MVSDMISFKGKYHENVFVNCPFDEPYNLIFRAIVFAIQVNGFYPRCALEKSGGDVRLTKIYKIISECKYGVHDISRVELDDDELPRFNMPFELGLFMGCQNFGNETHKSKDFLVLDTEKYRYQKTLSDLSGIDIKNHGNDPYKALKIVNSWLGQKHIELTKDYDAYTGALFIENELKQFEIAFPTLCNKHNVDVKNYEFIDLYAIIGLWLKTRKRYIIDDIKEIYIQVKKD